MRLIASMLGCFSILSAYLWLRLLISFLTYDTLRSWYRVSLVTYQGALTMILRYLKYLFWNLCSISMFVGGRVSQLYAINSNRFEDCTTYFRLTIVICCRAASTFCPVEFQVVLVYTCFLQFSLRSRCSPKYLASSQFKVTDGHVSLRMVNITCTDFLCRIAIIPPFSMMLSR